MSKGAHTDAVSDERMERFAAGMMANRCGVHGPYASGEALSVGVAVAAERAEGGSVAFGVGDELIVALDIEAQLVAAGAVPLRSDSPHWADALATAGAGLTGSVLACSDRAVVAVTSGIGRPRATSLLPPAHVCVVRASTIVDSFAAALELLVVTDPLPSAVMWIGGPSRTGDLEMKTTWGVHGPRTVDIVIADDRT